MPKIHISNETQKKLLDLMRLEAKHKIDGGLLDELYRKGISYDFVISRLLDK